MAAALRSWLEEPNLLTDPTQGHPDCHFCQLGVSGLVVAPASSEPEWGCG